ncbi:unnamed protein product [Chondrus crispus]|uniref:Uncharacterized protein n=1 Tax=Chondrus crispus TaxID=2769 RepID=R7QS68_CHOCR|nr:unnamed protein product [Chondrus crispus]CDF40959.1 unnamed protein product [Chondrus crispus]|eukprot:XP_005711253.1 unnamed protein product [Chondrus crispus]
MVASCRSMFGSLSSEGVFSSSTLPFISPKIECIPFSYQLPPLFAHAPPTLRSHSASFPYKEMKEEYIPPLSFFIQVFPPLYWNLWLGLPFSPISSTSVLLQYGSGSSLPSRNPPFLAKSHPQYLGFPFVHRARLSAKL